MMRNHKIVSTVNAMFLLGFVAQRIFGSFFSPFNSFLFLLSLRRFPLTSFRPTLKINAPFTGCAFVPYVELFCR